VSGDDVVTAVNSETVTIVIVPTASAKFLNVGGDSCRHECQNTHGV
jgi:hypothetical protein